MRCLLSLLSTACLVGLASGHGFPIRVSAPDGVLAASPAEVGVFELLGGDLVADAPGLGINHEQTGVSVGTRLGIETTAGLLYWDGTALTPTDSVLTILPPLESEPGVPNVSPVEEYALAADTPPLAGMQWAVYPGGLGWHADGDYVLTADPGPPLHGLYGAPVRLVDLSSPARLVASEPFVIPIRLGTLGDEELAAGLAAFDASLAPTPLGDYNRDGFVDAGDYARWRSDYGSTVEPGTGPDGDTDGLVTVADYTVWRDALPTPAVAVPEPATAFLIAFSLTLMFRTHRNSEAIR